MRVNEENFVTGTAEDVKPSYVEQVMGKHNADEEAHPDIRGQMASSEDLALVRKDVSEISEKAQINADGIASLKLDYVDINADKIYGLEQNVSALAKQIADVDEEMSDAKAYFYNWKSAEFDGTPTAINMLMDAKASLEATAQSHATQISNLAQQIGDIDDVMSDTSEKPVQNKVIKYYVDNWLDAVWIEINSLASATTILMNDRNTFKSRADSHDESILTLSQQMGDIETALLEIEAIADSLIGGDA